jgi:hypothetical protein
MTTIDSPEHVFYGLAPDLAERLGIPNVPYPVRQGRIQDVFPEPGARLDLLVEELHLFVDERPDAADHYALPIGRLALVHGVALARQGRAEEAVAVLGAGLVHDPDNRALRANLAVALQVIGRHDEALDHYRAVVAGPAGGENPLVLVFAARAHADAGAYAEALRLLDECPAGFWEDDRFRELYSAVSRVTLGSPTDTGAPGPPGAADAPGPTSVPDVVDRATADHTEGQWVYVLDPVEVRGLHDTTVVVGSLQPGTWYLMQSEEGGWARIADPEGSLEGWAPAAQVHRRSDPPPTNPAPAATAAPAWTANHTVPPEGLQAWAAPDPAGQVIATLASGVELQVVERRADWANVRAQNGWEAWVDGRRLVALGTPAPVSPGEPATSAPETTPGGGIDNANGTGR